MRNRTLFVDGRKRAEPTCVLRDAACAAPQHDEGLLHVTPIRHAEEPRRGVSKHAAPIARALAAALALLAVPALAHADSWPQLSKDYVAFTHGVDPTEPGASKAAQRRWPDHSPAVEATRKQALEGFKARLKAIPAASLSSEDALSRAVLSRQVDIALEGLALDLDRIPFEDGEGFYTMPEEHSGAVNLHNEDEAQDWIARIAALPDFYATETVNLRRGIATGFTQPALVVKDAVKVMDIAAAQPADQSPLLLPFATLPTTIPAERRAALKAQAVQIIADKVRPAQARLAAFFRDEYLPKARPALGAHTVPDGDRYYAYEIKRETTTELTPQQIHQLGVSEIARIHGEMLAIVAETGFHGDLKSFMAQIKADPQFYATSPLRYVQTADEIAKRIDYLLPRYFGRLPRLTYGVVAKPAALESTSGGYNPGDPAKGVAGAVTWSAGTATRTPLYDLPSWLAHEGVPGHHLQIALAQENTALPEYRRKDDVTAFVEGWALYSERLAGEMGVYQTAYERFGKLSMEAWRACRLQMDTGLHAMGWTRDQAAQCMKDNTAMSDEEIYRETDRYIGWPAQALAYKIGELRIEAIRAKAEKALGPRFDIRAFHDALLSEGALPLDLLQAHMDAWIAKVAAEKAA